MTNMPPFFLSSLSLCVSKTWRQNRSPHKNLAPYTDTNVLKLSKRISITSSISMPLCGNGLELTIPKDRLWTHESSNNGSNSMDGIKRGSKVTGAATVKEWATRFCCACWHLWKLQNEIVFGGRRMQPVDLVNQIANDAEMWLKWV